MVPSGINLNQNNSTQIRSPILFLLSIILLSNLITWWFVPAIKYGLPYFYNEDEAHHFNRVVEMVQKGDYNPHYFHKPSLHFYLRMPFVAAGFLFTVKQGQIKELKEIRTRDPNGLSGYAFTASHPTIVKFNRLLSIGFIVLSIFFAVLICFQLTESLWFSLLTGASLVFSPAFLEYGATIGVDAPMLLFCIASVYFAIKYYENKSLWILIITAICAGFAISSKYNALPIFFVPIIAVILSKQNLFSRLGLAIVIPIISFFLGSPFIFQSIPLFLDQFAYEIWHYGVASHEGHSAEPGLAQVLHYKDWIVSKGLSYSCLVASLMGLPFIFVKKFSKASIAFIFPITYFLLMIGQRANFERNMLVVLPFIAVAGSYFVWRLVNFTKYKFIQIIAGIGLSILLIMPQYLNSIKLRKELVTVTDTRNEAFQFLNNNTLAYEDVALSGRLQLPLFQNYVGGIAKRSILGLERFSVKDFNPDELFLRGYNLLVFGNEIENKVPSSFKLVKTLEGINEVERIIKNPTIRIYKLVKNFDLKKIIEEIDIKKIPIINAECQNNEEKTCWLESKITTFTLGNSNTLSFKAFSPWPNQNLLVYDDKFNLLNKFEITNSYTDFKLSNLNSEKLFFITTQIHSPILYGLSNDNRRLGVALKDFSTNRD